MVLSSFGALLMVTFMAGYFMVMPSSSGALLIVAFVVVPSSLGSLLIVVLMLVPSSSGALLVGTSRQCPPRRVP